MNSSADISSCGKNRERAFPILLGEQLFSTPYHVSVTLSNTVPDYLGIMHTHDFIEIVYVISGRAAYTVGESESSVKKGDLIVINHQTPHVFCGIENPENPFVAYDLAFSPDFLDKSLIGDKYFEDMHASFLLNSLLPVRNITPTINLTGNGFDDFSRLYRSMFKEFQSKNYGYADILRANIVELIVKIYRKLGEDSENNPTEIRNQMVDDIIEYIHLHYQEAISLTDISKRIYLSKDYLNHLIKKRTGMTFTSYLQGYRLERACELLRNTNEKVDIIIYQCGFRDPKFFYTVFKKHTGTTPGKYRKGTA